MTDRHTDRHTDIATYRKHRPKGRCFENHKLKLKDKIHAHLKCRICGYWEFFFDLQNLLVEGSGTFRNSSYCIFPYLVALRVRPYMYFIKHSTIAVDSWIKVKTHIGWTPGRPADLKTLCPSGGLQIWCWCRPLSEAGRPDAAILTRHDSQTENTNISSFLSD